MICAEQEQSRSEKYPPINKGLSKKCHNTISAYIHTINNQKEYIGKNRILQTICAMGIRVSELKFITVETVRNGKADIFCKGKRRTVFLPEKLTIILKKYIEKHKLSGLVFVTRNGKSVGRSNIWGEMKKTSESTEVAKTNCFRIISVTFFARTYYTTQKYTPNIADILAHSNILTTRIYTRKCGEIHVRQIERLGFVYDFTT